LIIFWFCKRVLIGGHPCILCVGVCIRL